VRHDERTKSRFAHRSSPVPEPGGIGVVIALILAGSRRVRQRKAHYLLKRK